MASALSSLRYGDSLSVVGISAVTAVLCEAISWLLIYRTATYNSLRASIERHSRKLDAMKSGAAGSSSSSGGGAALRLVAGEEDGPRRDQPQGRRAGALARQAQVRRRRRRRALRRLRPPQLPLRGPHRRQAALRARPARPADEPPRPARERPHRLLHGLPLLPLLHEHPDQPPETAWIRPAVRGCCGRRGTLPHARSQSQLSLFVDSSARYRIIAAEYLGEGAVVQPQWLQFMREWGPTVVYKSRKRMEWMVGRLPPRLRCRAESMLNKMPNELSREEGPTGPKEKNNWEGDERW